MQEKFAVIEDLRQQEYVKRKLCDILTMVMCAAICGLDELETVITYIQNRTAFFKENSGIPSVPYRATFSRVLRMIDGGKVAKVMVNIMKEQLGEESGVLAVDSKAASFRGGKRFKKKPMKFPSFRTGQFLRLHDGLRETADWDESEETGAPHITRLVSEACRCAAPFGSALLLLEDIFTSV